MKKEEEEKWGKRKEYISGKSDRRKVRDMRSKRKKGRKEKAS